MPQKSKKTSKTPARQPKVKAASPRGATSTSPRSPSRRSAVARPQAKARPSKPSKTRASARRASPPVAQRKAAPVAQRKAAPVAQRKAAPVAQRKAAPVAQRKAAPVAQRKAAPVAQRKAAPVAQRKAAPVAQQTAGKSKGVSAARPRVVTPGLRKVVGLRPVPVQVAPSARAARTTPTAHLAIPKARPKVSQETWRVLDAAAARLGRAELNDPQRIAIRAALEGRDCLLVLSDDERAVSCYQLAAQLLEQPTVVLSPIHAQLRAQEAALSQRNVPCLALSPELAAPERNQALARLARGGSLLVLLSPEALQAADVQQALLKSGIGLFVAEEAHCASEAAHELRPSYAKLGTSLRVFGSPPVMAVTRAATSAVRRDIGERLELRTPVIVQSAPVRENLRIVSQLARGEGRQASLVRLVERLELPGLVFCATPHDVDSVYSALRGAGLAVHRHHSGMTPAERAAELLNFSQPGQRSVMVAVSALAPGSGLPGIGEQPEASTGYGRGAARRDLRFVVHYQSPACIEQYLREIQQAGGDGKPATCVLLHESSHRSLHEVMLAQHRFKATHLAELARALEAPAREGRRPTLESLALGTGQSRRTTDRLTALLADAGLVSRSAGVVHVSCPASELDAACRLVGAQLYALREQDARRLAAMSAFAESSECKLSCLSQYLGEGPTSACGRCNACVAELLGPSQESPAPAPPARRAAAQEFSVQAMNRPPSEFLRDQQGLVVDWASPPR